MQAAESKAKGDAAGALEIITAIRAQQPQHARAHFAAGQLHAGLQQWQLAEEAYVAAARLEADLAQRARCLLGAGELPTHADAPQNGSCQPAGSPRQLLNVMPSSVAICPILAYHYSLASAEQRGGGVPVRNTRP